MGQVLHGSATTTEAVRRAIQRSQESLRALARRYGVNPKTIAKWKARSSVSDLPTGPREPPINGLVRRGRGCGRPLPKTYAAAARRLPLRSAADHSTSDALVPSSLPPTSWNLAAAADRGRSFAQAQVQDLSDRLLPRRHRRSADGARQALSLRRDRPRLQVRGRSARRQGQYADRARLLGGPCRRRALQDRDRAHRQRHPIRRPAKEPIRPNRHAPRPSFRSRLSGTWDRTSTDQAQSSLDQWTGRADEPDNQGRDRQAISLRISRSTRSASCQLRRRLRVRLQTMDNRA